MAKGARARACPRATSDAKQPPSDPAIDGLAGAGIDPRLQPFVRALADLVLADLLRNPRSR
jgi:hypothetical protein